MSDWFISFLTAAINFFTAGRRLPAEYADLSPTSVADLLAVMMKA